MRSTPIRPRGLASRRIPALLLAMVITAPAAGIDAAAPRRARPPKFSKSIQDAFFSDAREKLVGPRPDGVAAGGKPVATTPTHRPSAVATPSGSGWSQWISAEVLEDEVKSQQIELARSVRNPTQFKAGDYRKARAQLSLLAVMFGVVAEFDGQIRWKDEAAAVRDAVSRAGFNCKVGTDGSFQEARARSDDLQTLVRGGSLQLPEPAPNANWSQVADRPPLMKRLEQAQQEGIDPLTANPRQFERDAERVAHEAELIAAIAEVISREGYEYADDETYLDYARTMKSQALSVRDAAKERNYEGARKAAGQLSQTCTDCHDGYRG